MVRDMMQYKIKIDQLKQEKASLAVTYEVSSLSLSLSLPLCISLSLSPSLSLLLFFFFSRTLGMGVRPAVFSVFNMDTYKDAQMLG